MRELAERLAFTRCPFETNELLRKPSNAKFTLQVPFVIMRQESRSRIELSAASQDTLIAGARDVLPVCGLTHNFYRYPARFSPRFARAAIQIFTGPGDLVLDPYVGGGTSLIEALATGRDAIEVDISPLAEFVSRIKTTVFSKADLDRLDAWARQVPTTIHARKTSIRRLPDYSEAGYYKHLDLDFEDRWRLRKAIEQGLASAIRLGNRRLESFGRCVVLRTAQWALDGRARSAIDRTIPGSPGADRHRDGGGCPCAPRRCQGQPDQPMIEIINRPAAGIDQDERLPSWRAPKLVLTSPPYPGVHVLYHRWQVDGRKEAPLPFMIANKLDGAFGELLHDGDRKIPGLKTYFDNIRATMASIAALADEHTFIVQMVAFSTEVAAAALPRDHGGNRSTGDVPTEAPW